MFSTSAAAFSRSSVAAATAGAGHRISGAAAVCWATCRSRLRELRCLPKATMPLNTVRAADDPGTAGTAREREQVETCAPLSRALPQETVGGGCPLQFHDGHGHRICLGLQSGASA